MGVDVEEGKEGKEEKGLQRTLMVLFFFFPVNMSIDLRFVRVAL